MRMFAVLAVAVALAGCAGITDVIKQRDALYAAAPLNPPTLRPSMAAYGKALTAAQGAYASDGSAPSLVDAGISAANSNCRAWLGAVSMAEQRWRDGETNVGVLSALISGALAAGGVHRDVMTIFGLGSAAWQGYAQGFVTNVLGMSNYDLQVKVREAMLARAAELRAQAAGFTYPQAVDAIEEYQTLCTPQAAQALSRSALTATRTTVAPSGAITSAPISSAFQRDDSSDRIIAWWIPGNVVNVERQDKLLAWMEKHGINVSIAFLANGKMYEAARKQVVADLNIPEAPK